LEYPARIKIHRPCRAGVLVELVGEFDVSCLVALGDALRRVSGMGKRIFVNLAEVTFADSLCVQSLVTGAGPVVLCHPSRQFRLTVAVGGLEGIVEFGAEDDPGYEAAVAEAYGCRRTVRTCRRWEHHLYVRAGNATQGCASVGA
jgi:anti-anti-sigma regulatory factor